MSSRRVFLGGAVTLGGALLATSSCRRDQAGEASPPGDDDDRGSATKASTSALPDGLDPAHFIVHSESPLLLETPREGLGASILTPLSRLFVRDHLGLPAADIMVDPGAWAFEVAGVRRPRTVTRGELQGLGIEVVAAVLQCSGNGRAYFAHGPSGTPWTVGSAGCLLWGGVPLRRLVDALGGLEGGARFITATGGEPLPEGLPAEETIVERSVPIAEVLERTMLVWEVNGEPLPRVHGGPLRLLVPGYYGCNSVKWLRRLAFTAAESTSKRMRSSYRLSPVGQPAAAEHPSMWAMNVKSFITRPGGERSIAAGRVEVVGVAFAGGSPITAVEVSSDGGERWVPARLVGPDLGPYAWRQFACAIEVAPGTVTLASRATSRDGAAQPAQRIENEGGYADNSWRDHAITLEVCAADDRACLVPARGEGEAAVAHEGPHALSEPAQRGRRLFLEVDPPCGDCHALADAGADGEVGPDLDQLAPELERIVKAVRDGIGAMPGMGDTLSPAQLRDLARYVHEASRGARSPGT